MHHGELLKEKLCKSQVLSVASRPVISTVVTPWGDNHEQSGLLTDAACNLHISVGVEPANQSQAPIAVHPYHLLTAAVAPPRERVKREGKSKNEWCAWDRGRFVLSRSTFMPASFFHTIFQSPVCVRVWRRIFLVTIIHTCHLRGMKGKVIVFVVIRASARQ